jgi:penicillin G amidase
MKHPMAPESLRRECRDRVARLSGDIVVAELSRPVEVLRDRWGIPHIYAENRDDLFFAQGFVAAQDRLFQMDLWRRIAVGETAEILGRGGLAGDRFARLVAYRGDLDAEWRSYGDDARDIVTAFTRGINAYIDHVGDRLPIEFELLGCRPKRWEPEDCLGRMSGVIMARNFQNELKRARLIAAVGLETARCVAPADPPIDYAPADGLDLAGIDPAAILAEFLAATGPLPFSVEDGSNNWVVDGSRSMSGKPLLASDPHRAITLPSLRYLVHLHAPGWNVIGSGEPGLPGVAIGHNERIAWGFTIVCTDQADVYVEKTHPDDPTLYRIGDEWRQMETVREEVHVRGQSEPEIVELRFTRHGPVLYQDENRHRAFALRWVGSEAGAAAYLGSLALNRAQNWPGFLDALRAWKMPSENVIYADVDGNTGWVAAALTPVRENSAGLLPVRGADGRHEWSRFLDVSELPQLFNPPEPIVTANHNILPPDYEHTIAHEWAPPFRHARIRERLAETSKFDLADFQSIQHDVQSIPGRRLAALAGRFTSPDSYVEEVRAAFTAWNGDLSRESRLGPVYGVWLESLLRTCFSRHVPPDLLEFVAGPPGISTLLAALENPTPEWFGLNAVAECNRILQETFATAVGNVRAVMGDDRTPWRWDRLHTVSFEHPLGRCDVAEAASFRADAGSVGHEIAAVFNRGPLGQSGDGYCPNATRHDASFRQIHGSSYRHVFDLADWDRGLATSTPGQSGQPESPHYDDLLHLWTRDEYFPLLFSREAVEAATERRLILKPQ